MPGLAVVAPLAQALFQFGEFGAEVGESGFGLVELLILEADEFSEIGLAAGVGRRRR